MLPRGHVPPPNWRSSVGWRAQRQRAPVLRKVEVSEEAHAEQYFVANRVLAHIAAHARERERERTDAHLVERDEEPDLWSDTDPPF